jgi:enamine deaminase RidA (YjgF/YER057c/UK114 family)
MRSTIVALAGLTLGACTSAPGPLLISRVGPADSPLATSVSVPPGAELVYVSGSVPDAVNEAAPAGTTERYGDTETQTRSVLNKLDAALAQRGLSLADVVMMRVFLVAPPGQQRMDFAGMMRAYRERFATAAQPNKPARSTMQVAGLVDPGWLVEIEVTAARARPTNIGAGTSR